MTLTCYHPQTTVDLDITPRWWRCSDMNGADVLLAIRSHPLFRTSTEVRIGVHGVHLRVLAVKEFSLDDLALQRADLVEILDRLAEGNNERLRTLEVRQETRRERLPSAVA